jgi:hypothetical protein
MASQIPLFLTPPGALLNPKFSGPALAHPPAPSPVATSVIPVGLASALVISMIGLPDQPHPHLQTDRHHDPFAYGAEVGLALAMLYVGGRLVAERVFKL